MMDRLAFILAALMVLSSCFPTSRLKAIRSEQISASLNLPPEKPSPASGLAIRKLGESPSQEREDEEVSPGMRTEIDDNGEMVGFDNLKAAVVTARFQNVAERGGKVSLAFDISVPKEMISKEWMLEFTPRIIRAGDTLGLEALRLTGILYRKAQLRGYQLYERFLSSIITDSLDFLDRHQLEVFIRRNIPALYRFKQDSSLVNDSVFTSAFGVSEKEAVRHYTLAHLVRRNNRKISMKGKMKSKYIKMPLEKAGLRVDTVLTDFSKDLIFHYTQTIDTRPGLRKVSVTLGGDIYEEDRIIYNMPEGAPLDFYISSLSSLTEPIERFVKKVIERKVSANSTCYIDFEAGSSTIDPARGANAREIGRIKSNLSCLARDTRFDLDSIVVTASCSPEGRFSFNRRLASERAGSVGRYFKGFLKEVSDSLVRERGFEVDETGRMRRTRASGETVKFSPGSVAENWEQLDLLVKRDSVLSAESRRFYLAAAAKADPDAREEYLQSRSQLYKYLRERLYPQLRTVRFDFHMHRKGMLKDTVHTTEPDTVYARGLEAIKALDYKRAVSLLRPYNDYNAAVACCAMDYNATALDILLRLEQTDKVCYLLALVYSRLGKNDEAAELYVKACSLNPSLISRGNLDPEISRLIKQYGLNRDY